MIDRLLFLLYHGLWSLAAVPLKLFARKSHTLSERLAAGIPPRRLGPGSLWVHALSVGEVNSAVPLVKALREQYPARCIVFTAATRQGLEIARAELESVADWVLRMPMDFWSPMRRLIRFIDPGRFILVETDLWPGFLRMLKSRGVPVLLVNGRISPGTFDGYRRFPFLVKRMLFDNVDLCLMQSELDRRRLVDVGIPPEKVVTVGNIKFDREWAAMGSEERDRLAKSIGLRPDEEIWVAGSTHRGEEEIVLRVFLKLRLDFPNLRLIIAPRRIEESGEILRSPPAKGLKGVLRTCLDARGDFDLLVLDTIGELGKVYGICRVAFVGGSLVPEGGHNLLEPASLGRPVLFGPHTESFVAMSELLVEAEGGRQVEDEEELLQAMRELLSDPVKAEAMGENARRFAERNRGALKRLLEYIS
jgi:3-deoxy-D-manno-octulosonic-acid transferase